MVRLHFRIQQIRVTESLPFSLEHVFVFPLSFFGYSDERGRRIGETEKPRKSERGRGVGEGKGREERSTIPKPTPNEQH